MGFKFHVLLQPSATRDRDLAGQAVAVDGTAWLHQFLKVTIRDPNDPGGGRRALLYGAPVVVNNLAVRQKAAEQLVLNDELARLGITRAQLVNLAVLVGTDFHPGVPGIGPRTALKLLKSF